MLIIHKQIAKFRKTKIFFLIKELLIFIYYIVKIFKIKSSLFEYEKINVSLKIRFFKDKWFLFI